MARLPRGSGRASKHTGDQYLRGYRFSYPTPFVKNLGPWTKLWPLGERNAPEDTLLLLYDGVLRDGVIYPIWNENVSTVTNQRIVGDFEFMLITTIYQFRFYIDYADGSKLKIAINDGTTVVIVDTLLTPGSGITIAATSWQNKVYFGYKTATSLYSVTGAGVLAAIAGSPANAEFIQVVDNNMVVVRQNGSIFEFVFSVDSDPTNWTGSGSGSIPIDGELGRPQGFELYNDEGMLICYRGAEQLQATGQINPTFISVHRPDIKGAIWTYAVESTGDKLFYIGHDRLLHCYDGQDRIAGISNRTFTYATVRLYFSRRIGLLFVSDSTTDESLILDIIKLQWVGAKDVGWDWMTDVPSTNTEGYFLGSENNLVATTYLRYLYDLNPVSYTPPYVKTGRYYLGRPVWIDRVDLIRTNATSPLAPSMIFSRQMNGTLQDVIFSAQSGTGVNERGTYITYQINGPADVFQIALSTDSLFGPFLMGSQDVDGNIPTDASNPPSGWRGDQNADGNFVISAAATGFLGNSYTADGNLALIAAVDIWTRNIGFEQMVIYGREELQSA